jgi:two-component system, cell cycle sensor histidine kinase and response regulator CckA
MTTTTTTKTAADLPPGGAVLPGLGRRVLLVDDDAIQLKLVRVQLEAAGFVVSAACGATEAEMLLRTSEVPSAIVSDVVMHDVDGFTLCRSLRNHPKLRDVPIVLLSSAFDEDEDRALARKVGANALVSRSGTQQECIEALVLSLAEGPTPLASKPPPSTTDLIGQRMAHQLARTSALKAVAELRYETLFEHANDAVCLSTTDGFILDMNRTWLVISGMTREEVRGRHIRDFAATGHEDENADEYEKVAKHVAGRSPALAIRRADGAPMFMEFTTTMLDLDGVPTVLSIGRDVTALVEASRKLAASERQYRSLVENIPDVFWSATKDWQYTFFSPNVLALSGFSAEEILAGAHGKTLGRVHPSDVERLRLAREALSKTGGTLDIEYRWQRRDDRWRWIHLRAVRTSTGIDGIFSDVTTRKELEEQLFQSQKIEAVGQLTAGVAHDFNNILAVIAMNGALLMDMLRGKPDAKELAQDVVDAAARGAELTAQLLAFSRRQPSEKETLDINVLLSNMERMLVRSVGTRIAIAVQTPPALGQVSAISGQIEQVILNLAVNARDAMPDGGKITIHAENVDVTGSHAAVGVDAIAAGRYVRISVSDTGCGMDRETQRHVFEPFFTTKEAGKGTGLGLATCYGIVRHAGGHITLESVLGRGTTVHVHLPRVDEA